jgi:D-3-phosphoglycerate dehydrogenase
MRVIFYDTTNVLALGNGQRRPSLDAVLQEADYVTLHVPLTRQTENMIGANEIAQMKNGAYLLNASR